MAKQRMDLSAFVGTLLAEEDGDVLREGVRVLAQALMEAEVTELVGAERHERNDERTGYRNGSRPRVWDTRVGTIELAVPNVRPGSHRRGLRGLRLVISDAHEGLKQAVGTVLSGASWQRCRVHFMRNLLALVPHPARAAVAAVVRTIFA